MDPLISDLLHRTKSNIAINPNDVNAWARHAAALFANKYYSKSIETSRIALEIDADGRMPMMYRQAVALWKLNQQEEAVKELVSVLELLPNYDVGWMNLAIWYTDLGQIELAEQAIQKALQINPERIGTIATNARILLQLNRPSETIAALSRWLQMPNTPPSLYFYAAQAYRRLGEIERMKEASANAQPPPINWPDPILAQVASLATGKQMLSLRAEMMLKEKGPNSSLPLVERLFNFHSNDTQVRGFYAMVLLSAKQHSKAFEIIQGIGEEDILTEQYWIAFGNLIVDKAKRTNNKHLLVEGISYFNKSQALSSIENPQIYTTIGILEFELGNTIAGIDAFHKAINLYVQTGQIDVGVDMLSRAIIKFPEIHELNLMLENCIELEKNQR